MTVMGFIDFKAMFMFWGEYEDINLYKDIIFSWDLNMKETLSRVMPEYDFLFSKYKELTSHINLDLIKELDIESDHYKNLIEELKIKIFPNK